MVFKLIFTTINISNNQKYDLLASFNMILIYKNMRYYGFYSFIINILCARILFNGVDYIICIPMYFKKSIIIIDKNYIIIKDKHIVPNLAHEYYGEQYFIIKYNNFCIAENKQYHLLSIITKYQQELEINQNMENVAFFMENLTPKSNYAYLKDFE